MPLQNPPILIRQSAFRKQVSEQKDRARKWQKELGWAMGGGDSEVERS